MTTAAAVAHKHRKLAAQTPRTSQHSLKLLNEPLSVCWLEILVEVSSVIKIANIHDRLQRPTPIIPLCNLAALSRAAKNLLTYVRYGHSMRGVMKNLNSAPLTPAVLHILLALSTEERHGYGIMKQVESESRGKVKMGTGTLYGSLGRMMEAGLIRESDKKVDPEMDDERRIYYKITALGQATLEAELERYREVVAVAKRKQLAPSSFAYGF